MKKYSMPVMIIVTLLLSGAVIWWAKANQTTQVTKAISSDSEIISMKGIHLHPELTVYVKGEKIEIPQNIGIGAVHQPVHTHDDVPIIHLEYPSKVTKDDTRLGKFFKIWNKDFREFGQIVAMTVNGIPNTEMENYQMKDGDKIVLNYE